jgi:hypothetical protein
MHKAKNPLLDAVLKRNTPTQPDPTVNQQPNTTGAKPLPAGYLESIVHANQTHETPPTGQY